MMKQQPTDEGIRPRVLVAVVGTVAVVLALAWALKSKPAPTHVTAEAVAPVSPSDSARPAVQFKRIKHADATPVAETTEPPQLPAATRLSRPGMGSDLTAPGAAPGLAGFQGTSTYDYRTQAAQVTEAVRNAVAQEERRANAMLPGSATDFAQSQGAGGLAYQAQPGPVGRFPNAITQPERGGAAGSPGSAPQLGGTQGTGNNGSAAQGRPGAGTAGNALPPPQLGADTASPPGSAAPVSQDLGTTGGQAEKNAVELYREGERLRRAYVEEMRVKRVVRIVQARQSEGI